MTYEQAKELAATWVRLVSDNRAELRLEHTMKRPYGWVFFYQGKEGRLLGNAPIIIDRVNGELRATGTAEPIGYYLKEYEATIPPARMLMSLPNEP